MEDNVKSRIVMPLVSSLSLLAALLIITNIPSIRDWIEVPGTLEGVRWTKIGGVILYHLVVGMILLLFALILTYNMITRKAGNNLMYIVLVFYLSSIMFFWSFYIDNSVSDGTNPYTGSSGALHDSLWYIIFSLFIFFFYLNLEIQESDYPPMHRIITIIAGISPAFIAGIAGLLEGLGGDVKNYVNGDYGFLALLINADVMLVGLIYAGSFGVKSYYQSLKNVRNEEFIFPAQLQFGSLVGLTVGLIIFAINSVFNFISMFFPLFVTVFLSPLIILYALNPNYISTLAAPLYDLLVVDDGGIPIYTHKFSTEDSSDMNSSFLLGGVIKAVSTIFNEVLGSDSSINSVKLSDRILIVNKLTVAFPDEERSYIVALIALKSCISIRLSLGSFTREIEAIIQEHGNDISAELPEETTEKLIAEVFY